MLERDFQSNLITEIKNRIPHAIVLKTDPNYIQGFPDLLVLTENGWAALECKRSEDSSRRPNQEFWVGACANMQFSAFIYPENKEDVLDALQQSL